MGEIGHAVRVPFNGTLRGLWRGCSCIPPQWLFPLGSTPLNCALTPCKRPNHSHLYYCTAPERALLVIHYHNRITHPVNLKSSAHNKGAPQCLV